MALPALLESVHRHPLYAYDVFPEMLKLWIAFASSIDAFIKDETFEEYKEKAEHIKIMSLKYRIDIVEFVGTVREMKSIYWDMATSIREKYSKVLESYSADRRKLEVWNNLAHAANEFFRFAQENIKGSATYTRKGCDYSYSLNFW